MNIIKLILWALLVLIAVWTWVNAMITAIGHQTHCFLFFWLMSCCSVLGAYKLYDIWAIGSIVNSIKNLEGKTMKNNEIIAIVFYNEAAAGQNAWEFIEYLQKSGSPKKDGYYCSLAHYVSNHNMAVNMGVEIMHYVRFAQKDDKGAYQYINSNT